MTYLYIIYHEIWFRRHPLTSMKVLNWHESFALVRELVGLRLR